MSRELVPGMPVGRICEAKLFPPWKIRIKSVPCLGIKGWQYATGYWAKLSPEVPIRSAEVSHIGRYVGRRGGRKEIFEFTAPVARFVSVEEYAGGKRCPVFERLVNGSPFRFPDQAVAYMIEAAEKYEGTSYGYSDLVAHIVQDLYGVPLDEWKPPFELIPDALVCSSGDASLEEYARRKLSGGFGDLWEVWKKDFGYIMQGNLHRKEEPWPRAFYLGEKYGRPKFIHTERAKPPDYGPRRKTYRTIGLLDERGRVA